MCMGVLGFSGNYGNVNYPMLRNSLRFAMDNYDLIDISHDYGIQYNVLDCIIGLNPINCKARYIYKVGCNYVDQYDAGGLADETIKIIETVGENKIHCILFHRPSDKKLSSDIKYFNLIKQKYPNIDFGICSNLETDYNNYKGFMDIKVVQIAINPLDYALTLPFLNLLAKLRVSVQARSILSSGFLSGKYNKNTAFEDPLRSRYNLPPLTSHFNSRMDMVSKIIKYVEFEANITIEDLPMFLYTVFDSLPQITNVIRGGSSLDQISRNLQRNNISQVFIEGFIDKMEREWSCSYV